MFISEIRAGRERERRERNNKGFLDSPGVAREAKESTRRVRERERREERRTGRDRWRSGPGTRAHGPLRGPQGGRGKESGRAGP